MPEYLAPGVYVEETSFRSKSIEGVSTTTTGFVGPTRFGPADQMADVLTSLADFERTYGDGQRLNFNSGAVDNFVWHAARAFFENGGKRLYVSRIFQSAAGSDGVANRQVGAASPAPAVSLRARFPGESGNVTVRVTLKLGQNLLGGTNTAKTVGSLQPFDTVVIGAAAAAKVYRAERQTDGSWKFARTPDADSLLLSAVPLTDRLQVITATVMIIPTDPTGIPQVWSDLPLDPAHQSFGFSDSLFERFSATPANRAAALTIPVVIAPAAGRNVRNGSELVSALDEATTADLVAKLVDPVSTDADRTVEVRLANGNDGDKPPATGATGYEGDEAAKTGLKALEDLEEISIVAAPGSTFGFDAGAAATANTVISLLISHCERMRYRIAVIDSGNDQTLQNVRAMRAKFDSKYAALYYPWIRILDPITRKEIVQPPSGFVAGIYARNDVTRGVYKAPANETVALAIGLEKILNKGQQDVLNPEGINCFRFFDGRGFRLWGARTISSDPEWKYVNLRRYFAYVERSIDKGTQWAVFEPNGDLLWANVRRTVEDFLLNEWMNGALLGDKPEKAYFVRCDRSTMTQNDLDNGRLVCLVGLAPLRPAEFVIFRIGQWTADKRG